MNDASLTTNAALLAALRHSSTTVYGHDADLRYLWVQNPPYGLAADAMIGRRDDELFVDDHVEQLIAFKRDVLQSDTGARRIIETTVGGESYIHEVSAEPVLGAAGAVVGLVVVALDVSEQQRLERALAVERARLDAVLHNLPVGVMIAEAPPGRMILGNAKVAEIWRHSSVPSESVEGYTPYYGEHPDGRPYASGDWPLARSTQNGEIVVNEEIRIRRGDGTTGVLLVSSAPIRDDTGAIVSGVVVFSDITAIKQTEASLAQQLQITRHITDNAAEALFMTDREGRVSFVNPAAEAMFGFHRDELLGGYLHTMIHHHYPDGRPFPINECPLAQVFRTLQPLHNHEDVFFHKNGTPIHVVCSNAPILEDGVIVGGVLAVQDITARKRAAERARLLQRVTAALSNAMTPKQVARVIVEDGVIAIGARTGAVFQLTDNGAALELVDTIGASEELIQTRQHFPLTMRSASVAEAVRTNTPIWMHNREERYARFPPDAARPLSDNQAWVSLPLVVEGRILGGLAFSFAEPQTFPPEEREFMLTLAQQCAQALERAHLYAAEHAARLEAEKANRIRTQFLGMISHELRTPLASIKGFASSLLAEDVEFDISSQRDFLKIIDTEADNLSELVEHLLDLSRLQAGTFRVALSSQHIGDIVAMALGGLQRLAPEHEIMTDVPDALPMVHADMARIVQVFSNLVQNAAHYSPPGTSIRITARLEGDAVRIEVSDQGVGIAPEQRAHVFEAFRQLEESNRKGAGLGLAICKGIIEAHSGRIWVLDTDVPGATIAFTLPLS